MTVGNGHQCSPEVKFKCAWQRKYNSTWKTASTWREFAVSISKPTFAFLSSNDTNPETTSNLYDHTFSPTSLDALDAHIDACFMFVYPYGHEVVGDYEDLVGDCENHVGDYEI